MFKNSDGPLSAVLKAAADAVVLIDEAGTIQQVSDSVQRVFGYTPSECVGQNVSMFMPEPDRSAHDGYLAAYRAGGEPRVIGIGRSTTGRKKNGETFPLRLSVGEFHADERSYFVGICHDLTDYTNTLVELERAEKRYKDIVESQKHFICRLDNQLRVTFANSSFASVLGKSYEELIGTHLANLLSEESRSSARELQTLLSDTQQDEINVQFRMRTGKQPSHADWSFRRVENPENGQDEIQGLGVDVSDRESALSRARFLKEHDHLTGLLHGRSLVAHLKGSLVEGRNYAFLCIDPDRFGQVNQRYGYESGDSVIVQMARRAASALPSSALMARPGGDELLVAFPVTGRAEASETGEQVLTAMTEPYSLNGDSYVLDCRGGIALYPDDSHDLARMPELAEAAMREAKWQNCQLTFFTGEAHRELLRRISVEQALKTALSSETIDIHLQPKVSLATRTKCGYEALARWHHVEWGQVSPGEFIPIAEAGGLGPQMDRYVIRRVAGIAAAIRTNGEKPLPIAVNITANHFSDPAFADWLENILAEYSLPPSAIELEITEGVLIGMAAAISDNFLKLRELGIRISIDDFGTGYSSLSYLKKLDVDELKIDKSFIDDLADPKGELLVQSLIGLAKAYGLTVTAEGVEKPEQEAVLTRLGCDIIQGYLFSPALPVTEARNWRVQSR
ncbi:EAL domain-containing protein [Marinobacter salsuginis]|uniref:putative bifunctional diguanylate cyclase/phosphodiesterase n=1 Tax=Marinobacter salsuginis TaxID=418719 RepID=UPI001C938307|nr:EAL domain-containing protein [Marinobacter salsuginis]MBY6072016.1 EAL domain-containing protein [Marinobacter salsuginis]